ncbi:hypothetical protein B0H16DRAFT_306710 [Mycena metata]|uniref:Uncharacterized protein n=1 Tax=Mycena metata TaxID=1033252 RepID=A0AAD7KFS1_9AGAR|nr:hypothetical protein B0H16DRAFT_306710 [Mycena metata]
MDYPNPFNHDWPVYHDPNAPPTDPDYDVPQLDSSIGPSRVLTRRQRAALEHAPGARRVQPYDPNIQRHQSMYITSPVSISRPQTPPSQPEYPLALAMPPVVQPSPSYHPLTPSSASTSPYSTYGFYSNSHSRSNSISNTTNPRSASPALSTASALTSVSSSASGPNSSVRAPSDPRVPRVTRKTEETAALQCRPQGHLSLPQGEPQRAPGGHCAHLRRRAQHHQQDP